MKIERTNERLSISLKNGEGFDLFVQGVFYIKKGDGIKTVILSAEDLRAVLSTMNHPLARLALNALDAERYAQMAERPRWLVYEADSGNSFNTLLEVEGAARVEFVNGKVVWFDPKEGDK